MTRVKGPAAVDGAAWQELLTVLDDALHGGRRRALLRLAEREETAAEEAARELAAFPGRSCAALERGVGLAPGRCLAGRGCPVEIECPFVRGSDARAIARSALSSLVAALVVRWRRPLPSAPVASLDEFPPLIERLLLQSARIEPGSPRRVRTSLAVVDVAIRRGGPLGATGPFLTSGELEQVAAFVPPGSGRADQQLAPAEAWIRRAVCAEVALVDLPADAPG